MEERLSGEMFENTIIYCFFKIEIASHMEYDKNVTKQPIKKEVKINGKITFNRC